MCVLPTKVEGVHTYYDMCTLYSFVGEMNTKYAYCGTCTHVYTHICVHAYNTHVHVASTLFKKKTTEH